MEKKLDWLCWVCFCVNLPIAYLSNLSNSTTKEVSNKEKKGIWFTTKKCNYSTILMKLRRVVEETVKSSEIHQINHNSESLCLVGPHKLVEAYWYWWAVYSFILIRLHLSDIPLIVTYQIWSYTLSKFKIFQRKWVYKRKQFKNCQMSQKYKTTMQLKFATYVITIFFSFLCYWLLLL